MSEAYVIEVDGSAVGVVVRDRRSFRFYASDHAFAPLEHGAYQQPESAARAAEAFERSHRPGTSRGPAPSNAH